MLEDFLNPEILRPKLIVASIYITAFELLKSTIVERIRSFYTLGGLDNDDPDYKSKVLSRNRSPVYASLEWLKESEAIDDADTALFEKVKKCRNDFAHEIANVLMGELPAELPVRFAEMIALLTKIEKWWIINVDIATDPQFDGEHIDEAGIVPGPIMALQLMMDIALGSEDDSRKHLDEFRKLTGRAKK
jgi:hypothetical protein